MHTEGILQELPDLCLFQSIQNQLYELFRKPSDNAMTPGAFFTCTEPEAFYTWYEEIRQAFSDEHEFPPHTAFFGGLIDAKCKVQKGQVTARDQRPQSRLSYFKSYPTSELVWISEGVSIMFKAENELEDTRQARARECQSNEYYHPFCSTCAAIFLFRHSNHRDLNDTAISIQCIRDEEKNRQGYFMQL